VPELCPVEHDKRTKDKDRAMIEVSDRVPGERVHMMVQGRRTDDKYLIARPVSKKNGVVVRAGCGAHPTLLDRFAVAAYRKATDYQVVDVDVDVAWAKAIGAGDLAAVGQILEGIVADRERGRDPVGTLRAHGRFKIISG
jgi:hypothetical protein